MTRLQMNLDFINGDKTSNNRSEIPKKKRKLKKLKTIQKMESETTNLLIDDIFKHSVFKNGNVNHLKPNTTSSILTAPENFNIPNNLVEYNKNIFSIILPDPQYLGPPKKFYISSVSFSIQIALELLKRLNPFMKFHYLNKEFIISLISKHFLGNKGKKSWLEEEAKEEKENKVEYLELSSNYSQLTEAIFSQYSNSWPIIIDQIYKPSTFSDV